MGSYKLRFTLNDGNILETEQFTIINGTDGAAGYTPQKGVDYFDGSNGADGVSITTGVVNSSGELILTKSDETTINAGVVKGQQGRAFQVDSTGDVSTDGSNLLLDNNSGRTPSITEPYFHVVLADSRTASDNPTVYSVGTTDAVIDLAGHLIMTASGTEPKLYYSYGTFTGIQGEQGVQGNNGWSPIFASEYYGTAPDQELYLKLVDWTGGAGTQPTIPTDNYIGATGLVSIANAYNFMGAQGEQGAQGVNSSLLSFTDSEDRVPGTYLIGGRGFVVPSELNGMYITKVAYYVDDGVTYGNMTIDIESRTSTFAITQIAEEVSLTKGVNTILNTLDRIQLSLEVITGTSGYTYVTLTVEE